MSHSGKSISEGWLERIAGKIVIAGGIGTVCGFLYANEKSLPRSTTRIVAVNCAVATLVFAGLQESARACRQQVSPANSGLAGGVTGFLLRGFSGARLPVCINTGVLFGFVCSAVDACCVILRSDEEEAEDSGNMDTDNQQQKSIYYYTTGTWRDMLPVKKMSDDEWEEHLRRKEIAWQEKVDKYIDPK